MINENVCSECGRRFTPLQQGQIICDGCSQMDSYIMLRSNRFCRNCLS